MKKITFILLILTAIFQSCATDSIREGIQGSTAGPGPFAAYKWTSSGPLISPAPEKGRNVVSAKDPSVVYYNGKWHVFYTTCDDKGVWSMQFASFKDWNDAGKAKAFSKDDNPNLRGYHCAPNVFYFSPQKKWYMVFQSGQPQCSTNDDINDNMGWTQPMDFFQGNPGGLEMGQWGPQWLDFFVICDEEYAYLYFTGDNGRVYYSRTKKADFPNGMGKPVMALRYKNEGDLYEGGMVYRIKGVQKYLMLVEAIAKNGDRYYRSFVSASLEGPWTEDSGDYEKPFAGLNNVKFGGKPWTRDISHGEMIRDGYDETMTIDPSDLKFLYQGMDPDAANVQYHMRPYRIGLLTAVK